MSARRNTLITALLAIAAFALAGIAAGEEQPTESAGRALIDFPGYLQLSEDVMALRETRLVSLAEFNAMKRRPNTIVLDTRSADAFARGHIDGAVHLNFSDFTDEKLAQVVGSPETRILIYCNNNFVDNIEPVVTKRVELALNIPTFVNLYGYGYENVYELGDLVSIEHKDVDWVTDLQN